MPREFENAAAQAGVAKAASSYVALWSTFDNRTAAASPLGETKSSSDRIAAPASLPTAPGSFILAEVRSNEGSDASLQNPVRVYFRRLDQGWKLVGVERMPEYTPIPDRE
jgi:hypothetical protein